NVSSTAKVEEYDDGADGFHSNPFPEFQFPEGSPFNDFFEDFMNNRNQFGRPSQPALPPASLGSGFIIDAEEGYVATNYHVVRDAEEIRITLHDDSTIDAELIGYDEKIDVAVLKVDTDKKLQAVKFGKSDTMRVGDWVVAIGNPFGLGGTVTAGIISARQRDINSGPYDDYIQTDASINRGNSGGPMFNLEGEVIGINTAIYSPSGGSVGIGFAIPSNLSKPVIDQLIKYGRTRRGWLGVRIQTVTEEIAESLGLENSNGALIAGITPEGPAEDAKLEPGDIILEFDGKEVDTMRALPRIVAETEIDSEVVVKYWRDGKMRRAKVTIGELEKAEDEGLLAENGQSETPSSKSSEIESLGMSVASITDQIRDTYGLSERVNGVVVTDLKNRGEAAKAGVMVGDVIEEVNKQPIENAKEFTKIIDKVEKAKRKFVLLLVNREGDVRFMGVKLSNKKDDKKKR
ncbi:MAG: DegQ family serine endoprotease, partial [Pseudomonadota bacterium]